MAKNDKLSWAVVIFAYIRFLVGVIIIFYPFPQTYGYIINAIGALIALTSGVNVKFSTVFKDIVKPE